MNEYCDLRTFLLQAQQDLSNVIQTQNILSGFYNTGDLIVKEGNLYQATSMHTWTQLTVPKYCCEDRVQRKTNCKNCGAPLFYTGFCSYCETYN